MSTSTVQVLPINQLQPNPFQPRGMMLREDLDELVQSIKTFGILEPLVVAQTPAGYQIIAGERRWRAAKEAGLKEVPVAIRRTTPRGMLEMALVENVQRVDLSAIERAQAFAQLIREYHHTASALADKIGKSKAYISNTLKLLELPDAVKDGLVGGLITEGHARAISGIMDERTMVECYKVILKENASVRRAEELARRFKNYDPRRRGITVGRPKPLDDALVQDWASRFQSVFHSKTNFQVVQSERQTKITFVFKGPPQATQKDIEKMISFADLPGKSKK